MAGGGEAVTKAKDLHSPDLTPCHICGSFIEGESCLALSEIGLGTKTTPALARDLVLTRKDEDGKCRVRSEVADVSTP
jgi:hypothetical protein